MQINRIFSNILRMSLKENKYRLNSKNMTEIQILTNVSFIGCCRNINMQLDLIDSEINAVWTHQKSTNILIN